MVQRELPWVAWRSAWRPPEVVRKMAEALARRVEAAGLTGVENRGGGGGVPWREGEGRPQVEEWD